MSFNASKFKHVRYGVSSLPGEPYVAPDATRIERCSSLVDLGVLVSDSGEFKEHIIDSAARARRMVGWILRTFSTRDPFPMVTLFKSLVMPILEYCTQLWSPVTLGLIRTLEGVQRSFTWGINNMRELNYWERLESLDLYSLERRRERYAIIYIWKILNNLVPNICTGGDAVRAVVHVRRGKLCAVPPINNRSRASVRTRKEQSFSVRGPKLFNVMPRELRNCEDGLGVFKGKLDRFLKKVPDKPSLPNYIQSAASNSLLDQLAQQRAESVWY